MFLSAHEIAESREHALNNLLGLSQACLEAGQRLSALISSTSREAIHHGSKHWSLFGHDRLDSAAQAPSPPGWRIRPAPAACWTAPWKSSAKRTRR